MEADKKPKMVSPEKDFTSDEPRSADALVSAEKYNPEEFHDKARLDIAKRLIYILVSFLALFTLLYIVQLLRGKLETKDIQSFFQIVFPTLATLVSSTVAYYFGAKK